MYCPNCGNRFADNQKFCGTCGFSIKAINYSNSFETENSSQQTNVSQKSVNDMPPQSQQINRDTWGQGNIPQKRCKKCGQQIPASAKVCPYCNKKQNSKIVVIVAVLIALYIIGSLSNLNSENTSSSTNTNSGYSSTHSTENNEKEKELSEDDYKAACEYRDYEDILRNPDSHDGDYAKVSGTVDQIIEGLLSTNTIYIIDTNGDKWECSYKYEVGESHVLEGDYVTAYGVCKGTSKSTTVLGKQVTMPYIKAEYIE